MDRDSGLKRKVEVITKAKEMYGRYADNPLKLLQSIGGLDIAGLVGVYISEEQCMGYQLLLMVLSRRLRHLLL